MGSVDRSVGRPLANASSADCQAIVQALALRCAPGSLLKHTRIEILRIIRLKSYCHWDDVIALIGILTSLHPAFRVTPISTVEVRIAP